MNLYVIGNGVDIAHKLKTRYEDYVNSSYFCYEVEEYIGMSKEEEWFNLEEKLENVQFEDALEHSSGVGFNSYGADNWSDADHHRHMQEFEDFEDIVPSFRRYLLNEVIPKIEEINFTNECADNFITFNYTPLLEKIYGIKKEQIHYLHGSVIDEKSEIILGHNGNTQKSSQELMDEKVERQADKASEKELNEALKNANSEEEKEYIIKTYVPDPRWYEIDPEMYDEDPRTMELDDAYCSWYNDLIKKYEENFAKINFKFEKFQTINVMGHSYNKIDLEYFKLIKNNLKEDIQWNLYYYSEEDLKRLEEYILELKIENYRKIESKELDKVISCLLK